MNNFNFIAPFYDQLARLIFGHSIEDASTHFLGVINDGSRVLILGGGTGEMITQIPKCELVTYLEKSRKMIQLAKAREAGVNMEFIEADFLTFDLNQAYDFIVCPFFLDCFEEENLIKAIKKIKTLLKPNGRFLVIDFQPKDEQLLLSLMHLFFSVFSSLESKKLKNIHRFILQNRFETEKEEFFNKNMIFSRVYRNL